LFRHQLLSIGVTGARLRRGIPMHMPAKPVRDVAEMARRHRFLTSLHIRIGPLARAHAVRKILHAGCCPDRRVADPRMREVTASN
jgi:hypothetical protein